MSEESKKGPGRPRLYPKQVGGRRGAPQLVVRVKPEVYDRVQTRPEGPRAYLEHLVEEDILRDAEVSQDLNDVPGQLLIPEAPRKARKAAPGGG